MDPTRTGIDDALQETMRYSGARTEVEAVNPALLAARHRSRVEAHRERERRESEGHRPHT